MGQFKKGMFLGGLIGAFIVWLTTPKGKEFREKLAQNAEPLFKELTTSLKQLEGPTREMYEALVERAVAEYASKREMAQVMQQALVRDLKRRWKDIKKSL